MQQRLARQQVMLKHFFFQIIISVFGAASPREEIRAPMGTGEQQSSALSTLNKPSTAQQLLQSKKGEIIPFMAGELGRAVLL